MSSAVGVVMVTVVVGMPAGPDGMRGGKARAGAGFFWLMSAHESSRTT